MKKIITFLVFSILIIACSSKKDGNMIVKGQIKGLKKGTLYLQKMKDTILVSVDSIALLGNDTFILNDNLESPVIYYLTFDGNTSDKRIMFFGEEGTITINDRVDQFGFAPKISGSKNQNLIDDYKKVDGRYRNQHLDLIKKSFDAKIAKNDTLIKHIDKEIDRITRKRFFFATQFARNNADTEVAPYLALSELVNANTKWLDTINNTLTDKVKKSEYGKRLQEFIDTRKELEAK